MRKQVFWATASAAGLGSFWYQARLPERSATEISWINWPARVLVPEAHLEASVLSRIDYQAKVPSRDQQLQKLAQGTLSNPYDVLIIGGGATGTGCAVDAVTRYAVLAHSAILRLSNNMFVSLSPKCRGLRTALIEREDFAAGTSSRSTKLVHGGVRYLEKAVFNLDYGQLKLVFEALHERKRLLENAPHLSNALPIMTVSHAGCFVM